MLAVLGVGLNQKGRPAAMLSARRRLIGLGGNSTSQETFQQATDTLEIVGNQLGVGINPTDIKTGVSSAFAVSVRSEIMSAMASAALEAGPETAADMQPGSTSSIIVTLPAGLSLTATCAAADTSCVEPPAVLRLVSYSNAAAITDVLTNSIYEDGKDGITDVQVVSGVANVALPTHLTRSTAALQCTTGSGSAPCNMTIKMPLTTTVAASTSLACVELEQLGSPQVQSRQTLYTATAISDAQGNIIACECSVPKVGIYTAVRYTSTSTSTAPGGGDSVGGGSIVDTGNTLSDPGAPAPQSNQPEAPAAWYGISGGQIAGIVIGVISFVGVVGVGYTIYVRCQRMQVSQRYALGGFNDAHGQHTIVKYFAQGTSNPRGQAIMSTGGVSASQPGLGVRQRPPSTRAAPVLNEADVLAEAEQIA